MHAGARRVDRAMWRLHGGCQGELWQNGYVAGEGRGRIREDAYWGLGTVRMSGTECGMRGALGWKDAF